MRPMNASALICALAASALAGTAWANDALDECSAYSQAGMRDCLVKKVHESEATLKQAENKVANMLSKWDEDAKHIAAAKEKLKASGKAFAQYREAQCTFAASLGGGAIGNALEMRRLACVVELNTKRAEQLTSVVDTLLQR